MLEAFLRRLPLRARATQATDAQRTDNRRVNLFGFVLLQQRLEKALDSFVARCHHVHAAFR